MESDAAEQVGPNAWLVDEMYEQYLADPSSVSESWHEFFADYRPNGSEPSAPATAAPAADEAPRPTQAATPNRAPTTSTAAGAAADEVGEPLRGAAALIATNMAASLEVPTATSFREVPAKLLEVNRTIINGYLGRTRGGKVSFTHLIGHAVVRAIAETMPAMNASFATGDDGKPRHRAPRAHRAGPGRRRRAHGWAHPARALHP